MAAIVHCEIRVADLERAKRFYTTVFDWIIEPVGSGKYWLVRAGRAQYTTGQTSGIDAVLTLRQGAHPTEEQAGTGMGYVCNIEVSDIDETLEKVKATGGEVVRGKEPLEGVGFEAFCLDTEGNMFSVIHDEGLSALLPPTQA
jgi:uncharacterized protein